MTTFRRIATRTENLPEFQLQWKDFSGNCATIVFYSRRMNFGMLSILIVGNGKIVLIFDNIKFFRFNVIETNTKVRIVSVSKFYL